MKINPPKLFLGFLAKAFNAQILPQYLSEIGIKCSKTLHLAPQQFNTIG